MAISKKRVLGNDGHNMTLESEYSSEESSSDSYEIDERIRRKRESSGRTKKNVNSWSGQFESPKQSHENSQSIFHEWFL